VLDSLIRDGRYAWRWLVRSPAFAVAAILSLGLGVGVNTAMFSLVDAVLLRPLPVSHPETLVDVFTRSEDGDTHATTSYPDFADLKARNTVFSDMLGYSPMMAALGLGDRSRLVFGQLVTANYFQMLGVQPLRGRLLGPDDDKPGAERVVILSHRLWVREFAADPGVLGRALHIRGQVYTVVGVAPTGFTGVIPLLTPELWLPLGQVTEVEPAGIIDAVPGPGATTLERRGYRWLFVKGRLKPGVTAAEAAANIQVVGAQLAAAYAVTNTDRPMSAVPTEDVRLLVPEASGPLAAGGTALMATVGLVLLIACANVAGLLIARASARQREMSLRAAIGASRRRLVQQLLVEGAIVGAAGVAVAIAVAWGMLRALQAIRVPMLDLPLDVRLDARVLTFALVAALASGLLASLTPAIRASSPSLVRDLRGPAAAASASGRRARWPLRECLVGGQVALTVVLLVVASLLLRSLSASQAANPGFATRGLALISFDTDMVRYAPQRGEQFWAQALARVRAMPEVASAALASPRVPFDLNFTTNEFRIDDRSYAAGQHGEILNHVSVTPGYFKTLGVSFVEGRDFVETDRPGTPLVAIVNEAMARKFWPNESAVGKTITLVSAARRYEIVGVTADYKVRSVMENPTPYVHLAVAQRPATYNYLIARARGDAGPLLNALRRELLAMEPGLVFVGNGTMEQTFATTLLPARAGAVLAAGFGGLGLLLAAIGLYGVMAYTVSLRTREIGIRLALGARRGTGLRLILMRAVLVVGIGGVAGTFIAALAARVLGSALYGVGAADPLAWMAAVGVVTAAAILASAVPALRALHVDPARTLRAD
jgi:macrolide transport system ATP-binding/permease protein